jgi:hypothetical protein
MRASTRLWIRRLAPWVITGAVVAAILSRYSIERIAEEVARGDTLALIPWAVLLPIHHLLIQSIWDRWIINRGTGAELRYTDVVRGRAGSAVLLALGFVFSSGGYGVWIARKSGADVRTTFGVVMYLLMSGLIAICLVATAAVWLHGDALSDAEVSAFGVSPRAIGIAAPLIAFGFGVVTLLGPLFHRPDAPQFLAPWQRIGRGIFVASLAGRCTDILVLIVYTWLATRAFGLDIPLEAMASYLPVIVLIGSLPINIAGFGAVQAAWLVFQPWASGEQILAFQFVWHLAVGVAIVIRGLPFLRGVLREVERGKPSAPPDDSGR